MKKSPKLIKRRDFLKSGGRVAAICSAPMILPSTVIGQNAPSNRVTLGFIGMGKQGRGRNMGTFLQQPDTVVLAVCDVLKPAAAKAKESVDKKNQNRDCIAYQDFREVLSRDDLDAIVISTPDHWHVPLSMAALRAGKDVFCEKPSLTIAEGRKLVKEVSRRKAMFQWGIEDRSLIKYHCLAGWARSGLIGKLETIHVSLPHKKPHPLDEPVPVPESLDWNMWLGPAPFRPYTSSITGDQNWRNITDYSGGSITDWGAHLVDTAQVGAGVDASGPVEVSGTCTIPDPKKYQSNAPINYKLHYRYANGVEMSVQDSKVVDIKFTGSEGWVRCKGWNGVWSASKPEILKIQKFGEVKDFWPRPEIEHRDFLDSLKSRKAPAYHVEAGHRLSSALHLGHLAAQSGRTIKWDPAKEAFLDGDKESVKSKIYKRRARNWKSA